MTAPKDLTHAQLLARDGGDSLLDRWVAGSLGEEDERAVVAMLLSSTAARDEARLHIAIRQGVEAAAARPNLDSLRVAVRNVGGLLEVLADSLRPLPAAGVPVRGAEPGQPLPRSFPLDAIEPGLLLHLQGSADGRFRLDLELPRAPGRVDWSLEGPDGLHRVAEAGPEVVFPLLASGGWVLRRQEEGMAPASVRLDLLADTPV